MLKKFLIGIVVLSFSFTAFSQNIEGVNARIDAMSGSGVCDDIGWTIDHPAALYNWANQIQSTIILMDMPGIGKTMGAIIGIVQFNEFLYAGVTFNNRMNMPSKFYEDGGHFLDAFIDGAENAKGFPNLPDVNVCLKFSDNFKLGLGGYFEASRHSLKQTKKHTYVNTDGDEKTVEYTLDNPDKKVTNMGANVEARITIGPLTVNPQFTYGFPKINGEQTSDELTQLKMNVKDPASTITSSDINSTYECPESHYIRGASYFWTDIGSTFWLAGVIYESRQYQFRKTTDSLVQRLEAITGIVDTTFDEINKKGIDSLTSDAHNQWFHWFLAFAPSFSDNLYFAPEYNGGYGTYTAKDPDLPADTTFHKMYHKFRLGIEKPVKNIWFFDEIAFRTGFSAQWCKEWRSTGNFSKDISQEDESMPWKANFWGSDFTNKEAKITGGFGFKKGRGQFDISCDFLKWQGQGVLSGPACAMATVTCDFSRQFNSAEAVETPAPDSSPPAAVSSNNEPEDKPEESNL